MKSPLELAFRCLRLRWAFWADLVSLGKFAMIPARQGRCISSFLRGAVHSSPRPPLRYCLEAEQEPSLMIVSLHLDCKRLSYIRETR